MSIFNPTPKGDDKQDLKDAQKDNPTLLNREKKYVARTIRNRYDQFNESHERLQAELKVNNLRWEGHPWAQIDPLDERKVYIPRTAVGRRLPPVLNVTQRACDRYTAQIVADDPVLEGVPQSHEEMDRDAAEAATHVLAGEWERGGLSAILARAQSLSNINRSTFIMPEWDKTAGGRVPAQKFMSTETARGKPTQELKYVDASGNPVDDPEQAAKIWQGNITYRTGTPMNVRYSGHRDANKATELFWAELLTLREVYQIWPELRKSDLKDLLEGVPPEAAKWLNDLRGETDLYIREHDEDDLTMTGDDIMQGEGDRLLDEHCMVIQYFHKQDRQYPQGAHIVVVGQRVGYRGPLRYHLNGQYLIPVAQFRCLDHPKDKYGRALLDILRDPQQLLDFVNASVLSMLRSVSRARYFLQMGSTVRPHELLDEDESVIFYQGDKAPIREQPGELSRTIIDFVDRYRADMDDMLGIHETMQGKHVPGVSSGRHAEALRSGDETLLGLTRSEVVNGLTHLGRLVLAIVRREWTNPRRVRYLGVDRQYVDKHFMGSDIANVQDVVLKKGTLLLLSPAQKTETLYGLAQMGIMLPNELRRLAPVTDVAGVSLTHDPHYVRAHRVCNDLLEGPPPELMVQFQMKQQLIDQSTQQIASANALLENVTPEAADVLAQRVSVLTQEADMAEQQFQLELAKYMPVTDIMDQDPLIAGIMYEELARCLAEERIERLPDWWLAPFRMYAQQLGMTAQRIPPPMMPGMPEEGEEQGGGVNAVEPAEAPPVGGEELFEPFPTGVVP